MTMVEGFMFALCCLVGFMVLVLALLWLGICIGGGWWSDSDEGQS